MIATRSVLSVDPPQKESTRSSAVATSKSKKIQKRDIGAPTEKNQLVVMTGDDEILTVS
jgi:hypothetical protein